MFFNLIIDNDEQGQDNSPIPTKAALARGTSSRSSSKRKVPPIPVSEKKNAERRDHDSKDSARDSALDDGFDETDVHDEVFALFLNILKEKVQHMWM